MEIKKIDDIVIVYPPQNLDLDNAEKFKKDLTKIISNNPQKDIILNFKEVEYVNSTSLSVVINAQTTLKESDKKLIVCEVGKKLLGLIKIVNLYDVMDIIETEEEALLSLQKPVAI